MAWQKGQSGNPAGKPKGCTHRLTLFAARRLEELGFDPILQLVKFARDTSLPADIRLKATTELLPYRYSKVRWKQKYVNDVQVKAEMGWPTYLDGGPKPLAGLPTVSAQARGDGDST